MIFVCCKDEPTMEILTALLNDIVSERVMFSGRIEINKQRSLEETTSCKSLEERMIMIFLTLHSSVPLLGFRQSKVKMYSDAKSRKEHFACRIVQS